MRDDEGGCRFGWHPRILTFFITASLGLSIMSSLDCQFLVMDLGFVPVHYYSDELGFGLWSYAAPGGRCLTYKESRQAAGGIFDGDNIYSNVLMNNDTNWSIARIIAIVGIIFGAIALVSVKKLSNSILQTFIILSDVLILCFAVHYFTRSLL